MIPSIELIFYANDESNSLPRRASLFSFTKTDKTTHDINMLFVVFSAVHRRHQVEVIKK